MKASKTVWVFTQEHVKRFGQVVAGISFVVEE